MCEHACIVWLMLLCSCSLDFAKTGDDEMLAMALEDLKKCETEIHDIYDQVSVWRMRKCWLLCLCCCVSLCVAGFDISTLLLSLALVLV